MASRFTPARIGAAVLGASVALMATALPAAAEVHAVWDPHNHDTNTPGYGVHLLNVDPHDANPETGLIGIKFTDTEGGAATYCVELPQETQLNNEMTEVPWDKYPGDHGSQHFKDNNQKINWILQNSFPAVQPSAVGKAAGVELSDSFDAKQEVITATQAAIWHYSNGADLDRDHPLRDGEGPAKDVVKIYDYLLATADKNPQPQPAPSLDLSPAELAGHAGSRIGPFTVTTTASAVTLDATLPAGVTITDADGKELPKPTDGKYKAAAVPSEQKAEFYVNVPADAAAGEASISLHADAVLEQGRLFVRSSPSKATQTLIVASSTPVKLDSKAKATWTPQVATTTTTAAASPTTAAPSSSAAPVVTTSPAAAATANTNNLAYTGASIFWPVLIGVVLVAAGGAALFLQRRKKRA